MADELLKLIIKYNHDQELNNLKDILDYLQNKPVYVFTTIKISKQKLKRIPKNDLLMILDDLKVINNRIYFSVYSNQKVTDNHKKYCLEVSIFDCILFMKRMAKTDEIIIDLNIENNLILDKNTIIYLKNRKKNVQTK